MTYNNWSGESELSAGNEFSAEFGLGDKNERKLYPELFPELAGKGLRMSLHPRSGRLGTSFAGGDMANELEAPRLGQIVVTPRPNIADFIDYLDATVIARGRVAVPTAKVAFLVKLDPPDKPTWWKRLWLDPLKVVPNVRVTVELAQVGASLFPFSKYARDQILVRQGINEYLLKLHSASCGGFATALGGGYLFSSQAAIERDLGLTGQLDALLRTANIKLPVTPVNQERLFWIVYATFPAEIRKYLIPEERILLDEFEFDKSTLTKTHIGKIMAIARDLAARIKSSGPQKIGLTGHTDSRGTEKYNQALGDRRVAAVREALVKAIEGIRPGLSTKLTILTKSFGETKPLVAAKTESEHARNRRVEVFLPKLVPRCPRVSLKAVIGRALKLLPRLSNPDAAKRLSCVLRKLLEKGVDDRFAYGGLVLEVFNNDLPFGTYPFSLLRDSLSASTLYGPSVPDAQFLRSLEQIDTRINEGISTLTQFMQRLLPAASQGTPIVSKMKAMDALRAWVFDRTKDNNSIYSCYR